MQARSPDPVADLALAEGLVTESQVRECQRETQTDPHRRSISVLLVDKGYLPGAERERLVLKAPPPAETASSGSGESAPPAGARIGVSSHDVSFGKILLTEGKVTREQLEECLRIQFGRAQQGQRTRLGEVLVERGYLTPDQVREALGEQHIALLRCYSCGRNYNVRGYKPGATVPCPICKEPMAAAERRAGVSATATVHPPSSRAGQPRIKPSAPGSKAPPARGAPGSPSPGGAGRKK